MIINVDDVNMVVATYIAKLKLLEILTSINNATEYEILASIPKMTYLFSF
jgi:hypothetical protein